jgi:hypothetical protein
VKIQLDARRAAETKRPKAPQRKHNTRSKGKNKKNVKGRR